MSKDHRIRGTDMRPPAQCLFDPISLLKHRVLGHILTLQISSVQFSSVSELCPTLCNPMDHIVHGILQARILERIAIPFSIQGHGFLKSCPLGSFYHFSVGKRFHSTNWGSMYYKSNKSSPKHCAPPLLSAERGMLCYPENQWKKLLPPEKDIHVCI